MEFKSIVFNAARDGKLRRLKQFLDHRPKEEVKLIVSLRTNGATPLLIAARNGYLNVVEYLIEKCNADIEQVGSVNFDGESIEAAPPIWCASAAGHLACVKSLITHGANVNNTTKTNSTPLRAACFDGHLEIVKFLVECGADIEIANRHGHTCLMIACYKGHLNIAQYLIANGAAVNRKSIKGNTALHDCAESGSVEIMKLLLLNGAIMDTDSYGMTPLKAAALSGHSNIVDLIISVPLCSREEMIEALELLGATYVDKKHDMLTALSFWRRASTERNSCDTPVLKPRAEPKAAYESVQEFISVEELEEMVSDPDMMRMQSLLIRERILGAGHPDTSYYIRYRGAVYADSGNYCRCIRLWIYALDMQQKIFDPLNTMTQSSLLSFVELFSLMMSKSVSTVRFGDLFAVLHRSIQELEAAVNRVVVLSPNDYDLTNYNRTINIVLSFLGLLCRLKQFLSASQEFDLKAEAYRLVRLNPRGKNGSTLLHIVCNGDNSFALFPFYEIPLTEVLALLLEVGHPVNVTDNDGNTPLHLAASAKHLTAPLFSLLLKNGAHIDVRNTCGKTPLQSVSNASLKIYEVLPLKYISLQCLCAQTINRFRIPFKGKIGSKQLEDFIETH